MQNAQNELATYYFHQGTNYHAYEYLGCHGTRRGKTYIYTFRTWAPNAHGVFVVGDAFGWDDGLAMERMTEKGIWECVYRTSQCLTGSAYKFRILSDAGVCLKGDPYAFSSEGGAGGASYITERSGFAWGDRAWLQHRKKTVCSKNKAYLSAPLNIYEMHFGSFRRHENGTPYSYREMAEVLPSYLKYMGYTHVELMPLAEFPYDGSWGYQICAFYAPTSRFGTPDDLRFLISRLHEAGLGVIMDWVPAHFPRDEWGLYEFDGRPLYEYQGRDRMDAPSWGTRCFDLGREEVQSFLISNAVYWLREFHFDGLRVDAVASMLYLDYDRAPGEWLPNTYGGNQNLEAVAFLQKLNDEVHARVPDALMIAEESTAWQGVTHPTADGGLGFDLKWNMGWANDFYRYLATDPLYRRYHHTALNFPIMYAFSEKFILPVSHDEVVHGKGSLIQKMYGTYEEKFRQLRTTLAFMMTFPGKKMLFMGTEFAQFSEWAYEKELEWFMLDYPAHAQMREFVASLNRFYLQHPALWEQDFTEDGFVWIAPDAADENMVAYRRVALDGSELVCVMSFSGSEAELLLPVPQAEAYTYVFETEGNGTPHDPIFTETNENGCFLRLALAPMSGVVLEKKKDVTHVVIPHR